ncbi:MAG: DALR domain-containing protein [Acidobacteriota bacterium]
MKTAHFAEGQNESLDQRAAVATKAFEEALDDDLNTAEALAAVYEYVRDTNSAMDAGEFRTGNVAAARAFLAKFDSIFDVLKPTVKRVHSPTKKWKR